MASRTDRFDIAALRLLPGEGRQLELDLRIEPFELGGHTYAVTRWADIAPPEAEAEAPVTEAPVTGTSVAAAPVTETSVTAAPVAGARIDPIPAKQGISRMSGQGYALHLEFSATLHGPCMRCLEPADPQFRVEAREISQPDLEEPEAGVELVSPYVVDAVLDLGAWGRDALALALPAALLCQPDCLGLCPTCGTDLNLAGPEHFHAPEPDPRWAALSELKLPGVEEPAGD
jgi:uncharacterized protein